MHKKPFPLSSLPLKTKITGLVLILFLSSIWVLTSAIDVDRKFAVAYGVRGASYIDYTAK